MDSSLDRLEDLLVRRSLEGLHETEAHELKRLIAKHPEIDVDAFDRAAAAISVARVPVVEEMPARLYDDIAAIGVALVAQKNAETFIRARTRGADVRKTVSVLRRRQATSRPSSAVPWLVAMASLVAAALAWWPGQAPDPLAVLTERRAALIAAGAPASPWSATDDVTAASATGDVVWDDAFQEGYMRIFMLQSNDPRAFQYQLWIFDAGRDARYPVDGGVFDVPPGSADVIVPIRANVPVGSATMFAITVERPGGVVVSDRERIVLIADFG